jgi:methyl-accepting chemotaxis protein
MFVTPAERDTGAYRAFWDSLNRGEYRTGEYQRVGKDVWIQASYNPILDLNSKPYKVVKYATVTTAQVIVRMKSEHIQKMLESVASGAEELNASVRDIAASTAKSKGDRQRRGQQARNGGSRIIRPSAGARRRRRWRGSFN